MGQLYCNLSISLVEIPRNLRILVDLNLFACRGRSCEETQLFMSENHIPPPSTTNSPSPPSEMYFYPPSCRKPDFVLPLPFFLVYFLLRLHFTFFLISCHIPPPPFSSASQSSQSAGHPPGDAPFKAINALRRGTNATADGFLIPSDTLRLVLLNVQMVPAQVSTG